MEHAPPQPSQASSHFQIEPVSGATLFEQETRRRDALAQRGRCFTGCRELDDQVLLGGFERGCVVGISAEEEDVGLLIGLQTVARLFVASLRTGQGTAPRATIITTLSAGTLLPILRDTFKAQIVSQGQDPGKGSELLKRFLETISISRVFDVSGLWEALEELNNLSSSDEPPQEPPSSQQAVEEEHIAAFRAASTDHGDRQGEASTTELSSSPLSDPPSSLPDEMELVEAESRKPAPGERTEIADSEGEGDSLSPLSQPKAPPERDTAALIVPEENNSKDTKKQAGSRQPDIILITHMSTVLSSLFRLREKDTAHQTVQLLSSHLRYVSHSPDHVGPLIIILNSTTSPQEALSTTQKRSDPGQSRPSPPAPPPPGAPNMRGPNKTLDPTLRSIFNPPPLPATGLGYTHDTPLSRRNKPSFGLIFTQMLDIHLLCTRVPRTRADAEALFAPQGQVAGEGATATGSAVGYGWVVEVLLDEVGVWEGEGEGVEARRPPWGGARRASREQRWGAVDVRRDGDGARVVDASGGGREV
ncbi:hypothetical protein F5883DRAFT_122518 [Diaporthe sp. PMI_573]|nr:hypothetical protein F5883DRAFT_122518 [Diaporthaceae sp. PMI_573]